MDAEHVNKMAAYSNDPSTSKQSRLEPESDGIQLTDLNDYCLIALFRYLPLKDLNAVSATCERLRGIAVNHVYRYQSSLQDFEIESLARRYMRREGEGRLDHSVQCIREYLQLFGPLIQHLSFSNQIFVITDNLPYTNEIFNLISKYCVKRLNALRTSKLHLDSETLFNARSLFSNLIELETDNYLNLDEILPYCFNLVEFNLWGKEYRKHFPLLPYIFPKLKIVTMTVCESPDDNRTARELSLLGMNVNLFLNNHLNLTTLNLRLPGDLDITVIGQLIHLEVLSLHLNKYGQYDPFYLQPLHGLSKLRNIRMILRNLSVFSQFLNQLASVQTLEHLYMDFFEWDEEFADGLSRFPNLRHLTLKEPDGLFPDVSDTISQRFNRFNQLLEIRFTIVDGLSARRLLDNLTGARHSVQTLTIHTNADNFGAEFVSTLGKFNYLQNLDLEIIFDSDEEIDCQPFQHLTQLKDLNLLIEGVNSSKNFLENVLTHLGSRNSLEIIKFTGSTVGTDGHGFITALGNFANLKELTLIRIENLSLNNLNALGQFHQIRIFGAELTVTTESLEDIFAAITIEAIANLAEKWPLLDLFDFEMRIENDNRSLDDNKEIGCKISDLCNQMRNHPTFCTAFIGNYYNTLAMILAQRKRWGFSN